LTLDALPMHGHDLSVAFLALVPLPAGDELPYGAADYLGAVCRFLSTATPAGRLCDSIASSLQSFAFSEALSFVSSGRAPSLLAVTFSRVA